MARSPRIQQCARTTMLPLSFRPTVSLVCCTGCSRDVSSAMTMKSPISVGGSAFYLMQKKIVWHYHDLAKSNTKTHAANVSITATVVDARYICMRPCRRARMPAGTGAYVSAHMHSPPLPGWPCAFQSKSMLCAVGRVWQAVRFLEAPPAAHATGRNALRRLHCAQNLPSPTPQTDPRADVAQKGGEANIPEYDP